MLVFLVLATPRESSALESAKALIERQKEKIEELSQTVFMLQQGRGEQEQRLQQDLVGYVQENQRLRLQLDALKGDLQALEYRRTKGDNELQTLVETLAAAEKAVAERDALIRRLQVKQP